MPCSSTLAYISSLLLFLSILPGNFSIASENADPADDEELHRMAETVYDRWEEMRKQVVIGEFVVHKFLLVSADIDVAPKREEVVTFIENNLVSYSQGEVSLEGLKQLTAEAWQDEGVRRRWSTINIIRDQDSLRNDTYTDVPSSSRNGPHIVLSSAESDKSFQLADVRTRSEAQESSYSPVARTAEIRRYTALGRGSQTRTHIDDLDNLRCIPAFYSTSDVSLYKAGNNRLGINAVNRMAEVAVQTGFMHWFAFLLPDGRLRSEHFQYGSFPTERQLGLPSLSVRLGYHPDVGESGEPFVYICEIYAIQSVRLTERFLEDEFAIAVPPETRITTFEDDRPVSVDYSEGPVLDIVAFTRREDFGAIHPEGAMASSNGRVDDQPDVSNQHTLLLFAVNGTAAVAVIVLFVMGWRRRVRR